MKRPVVELSDCVRCEICVAVSLSVFSLNEAGFIEIAELNAYPEEEVDDAIKNCPEDCIYWMDV